MISTATSHSERQLEFFADGSTPFAVRSNPFGAVDSFTRATDPETSRRVAKSVDAKMRWGSQRHRILVEYSSATDLTDEEAGMRSGLLDARACYWKRCGELRDLGLIVDTGSTRKSYLGHDVIVCRLTDAGREALQSCRK
jgi:hypothetical protein